MADFCKTCKHCDTGEYDEPCFSCRNTGGGIPTKWEAKANCNPQTNGDRIRAMSDELPTNLMEIPINADFGTILNCAVRYAIGRQTYMPGLVIDFIRPLLPFLSDDTLWVFDKDIEEATRISLGDPIIDAPRWRDFHQAVKTEMRKRHGVQIVDEIKHCKCGNEYTSYSEVLSLSRNGEQGNYLYTIRCPFCKKAARGGGPNLATARKLAVKKWNEMMEEVNE